jgi:hypothetical protein
VASFGARIDSLEETVQSILDQVDELHVYLNEMDRVPYYLKQKKIKVFRSQDEMGDLGDAGKFYTADQVKGYHFTIDDDIIYPKNYVATMIAAIEKYGRRCAVSHHGRNFDRLPVQSYYHDATQQFSCLREVGKSQQVHVCGTGVLAYHTDTLRISVDEFEYTNMGDIWFSKHCAERNIPIMVLEHRRGWIKLCRNFREETSIFTTSSRNDSVQTSVLNSVKWKLPVLSFPVSV